MRQLWIVLWLACAFMPAGCSRQETGWRDARREDSVLAYETYLEHFPAGAHAREAQARIRELHEELEWARATRLQTPEGWQRYLGAFPEGRHAADARANLSDYVVAKALPDERDWVVQLGAYSSEAAAREELSRLSRENADLLGNLQLQIQPPEGSAPRLWRLRAGPLAEAAARKTCMDLESRAADCVATIR